jgi:carbon monoxide dehydrogenase subunit G
MTDAPNNPTHAEGPAHQPKGMSLLKKFLLGMAILLAVLVGFIAMQPAEFRVVRSTKIAAPAEEVFAHVNDFHAWKAWSPWAKLDPESRDTYEGAASGTGSIFKWSGNNEVGEGSMTLTESRPSDLIRIKLDFVKPFAGTSNVEFNFEPEGDQTLVTWNMDGQNGFISKAICLLMDMDKMVGGKFEEGLASLKSVLETARQQ